MWHFSWNLHGLNWWKVGFTSHRARQRTCHRVVPVEFRRVSALSVLASARPRRYRHFVDELHLFFLPGFCGQFGLLEPASASVVALDMPMNCSSRISNLENFFFCLLTWSTFLLDVRVLFHCTFILMILTFTASSTRLFTCDFSYPGEMLSLRRHLVVFWAALPPLGSRVAGHVCSQLVHWFAAGSCLEILSNWRVSELRVLDLLRDFRNLDDLLHL